MGTALDTIMLKKPQKFFDATLNNDLSELRTYLSTIHDKVFDENLFRIPQDVMARHSKTTGSLTKLGVDYYNIFTFVHPAIYNLQKTLRELTKDACAYYEIDFDEQQYLLHGWFNLDYATPNKAKHGGVNPLKYPNHFHDHSDGLGAPWFHGYYCVDAEPSSTFYQIDRDEKNIFENINKNNRAIISETGHPHGRDDWFFDNPRITIAYDVSPLKLMRGANPNKWVAL